MAHRVDPNFMEQLVKFGASDIRSCFNCGNCTAICPHSEGDDAFPRRHIRLAQVGMGDVLAGSKELWVCYYCGECSDTCPREAEPGEFVAAARRYAIASNDVTGLSRLLYTSPIANVAMFLITAAVICWYLLSGAGSITGKFFQNAQFPDGFIRSVDMHDLGIYVMAITGVVMLLGVGNMLRRAVIASRFLHGKKDPAGLLTKISRGCKAVVHELFTQKRYKDCATEHTVPEPWYRARWFAHWTIFWGFLCLLFATTWAYLDNLVIENVEDGALVPLYYPSRLAGIVGGLLLIYGLGLALWQRLRPTTKYARHSVFSDWVFLVYLFLLGVTGFLLTVQAYVAPTVAGNVLLVVHIVLALQLFLMLPFTKFAHAVYRTLAIFIHAFRVPLAQVTPEGAKKAA